jgi:hypothetical protein
MGNRNHRIFKLVLGLMACLILGLYVLVVAKTVMWKWVDEKGIEHYVDEFYKVPDKYKPKAVKVEIEGVEQHPEPPNSSPPHSAKQEDPEAAKKAEWVAKAMKAVAEVKRLEELIKNTQQECDARQRKWETMPSIENKQAVAQCIQNLDQIKADLAKAKEYKESGIYKEAQEAGVPITWFDKILQQN